MSEAAVQSDISRKTDHPEPAPEISSLYRSWTEANHRKKWRSVDEKIRKVIKKVVHSKIKKRKINFLVFLETRLQCKQIQQPLQLSDT